MSGGAASGEDARRDPDARAAVDERRARARSLHHAQVSPHLVRRRKQLECADSRTRVLPRFQLPRGAGSTVWPVQRRRSRRCTRAIASAPLSSTDPHASRIKLPRRRVDVASPRMRRPAAPPPTEGDEQGPGRHQAEAEALEPAARSSLRVRRTPPRHLLTSGPTVLYQQQYI